MRKFDKQLVRTLLAEGLLKPHGDDYCIISVPDLAGQMGLKSGSAPRQNLDNIVIAAVGGIAGDYLDTATTIASKPTVLIFKKHALESMLTLDANISATPYNNSVEKCLFADGRGLIISQGQRQALQRLRGAIQPHLIGQFLPESAVEKEADALGTSMQAWKTAAKERPDWIYQMQGGFGLSRQFMSLIDNTLGSHAASLGDQSSRASAGRTL